MHLCPTLNLALCVPCTYMLPMTLESSTLPDNMSAHLSKDCLYIAQEKSRGSWWEQFSLAIQGLGLGLAEERHSQVLRTQSPVLCVCHLLWELALSIVIPLQEQVRKILLLDTDRQPDTHSQGHCSANHVSIHPEATSVFSHTNTYQMCMWTCAHTHTYLKNMYNRGQRGK